MLRSMYSGISGMKANQTKLDVIGNNIANVGTTGFKSSTARFQDMLSQSVKDSMAPNANQGGVNSAQVGLGVKLASIDSVMKQGNLQPTGRALDMAIDGDGFFMVSKGAAVFGDNQLEVNQRSGSHNITAQSLTNSGAQLMYTRDGAFSLDEQGNLITADGYRVMGYALSNDDTSVPPTAVESNNVNLDGLDFKFGPGSALNGYKVVFGAIGPQTVTSAEVDTKNMQIVVSGDFSTNGALTAAQVESAVNKALDSAGIAQSVFVANKPELIGNLTTDKATGGLDNSAPGNVQVGGLNFQFETGSQLEKFTIEFDKVGDDVKIPDVNVTKSPNKIKINANFATGNLDNSALMESINQKLKEQGITQKVKNITGSLSSLSQMSATVDNTGSFKNVPTLTPTTIGGLTFNFSEGGKLNNYTIKFGNNSTGVAQSVDLDTSGMTIVLNGDLSTASNINNLIKQFNNKLQSNSIFTPQISTIGGTFDSSKASETGKLSDGSDDVKPSDVQVGGFKLSFPAGTTYNGYTFEIEQVDSDSLTAKVDPDNKKLIRISGNFLSSDLVTSEKLEAELKKCILDPASGISGANSNNYDSNYKISVNGSAKVYSSLVSDPIIGGTSAVAPSITSNNLRGLNLQVGPGAQLNGYTVQIGKVTPNTSASVDVDTTNKKIILNGDFITPSVTLESLNSQLSKQLLHEQITQQLKLTGTLNRISPSQAISDVTNGGTPVESLDPNGDVTYVDGTKTLKAYDGALKTLRIPEKVKIPGTDTELRIKSYTIDKNGIISGVLEDGKVAALGQVAMAAFKNASGLTKQGGNLYSQSVNSGEATIKSGSNTRDDDNSKGFGDTLQGMLEMSNVDLAEQFTDMITATRAFQASSKMINTGDEILQDIINLKR